MSIDFEIDLKLKKWREEYMNEILSIIEQDRISKIDLDKCLARRLRSFSRDCPKEFRKEVAEKDNQSVPLDKIVGTDHVSYEGYTIADVIIKLKRIKGILEYYSQRSEMAGYYSREEKKTIWDMQNLKTTIIF